MKHIPKTIASCAIAVMFLFAACRSDNQAAQDEDIPSPSDSDYPDLSKTKNEDCPDLDSLDGDPTVAYYRLRFEYAASSNWSKLEFIDPENILSVRAMSVEGDADKAEAGYGGITVNQPKNQAEAGAVIEVTADYAIRPEALDAPFVIKLGQGVIGSITLKISTVVGDDIQTIKEVTEPRDAEFQLDLSSLSGVSPSKAPIAPVRRMGWALYYPWYNLKSWEADHMKDQPEIPYDSGDLQAVTRQISQAKSAGIDGFISSWWGPGSRTDENLVVVLEAAGRSDFFIGMFLETKSIVTEQGGDMARVEDELVRWIEHYVTNYKDHLGTMKVAGKTFVMPWITCTLPVETWQNVRDRLDDKQIETTMVADCSKPEYFDVFDGALGDKPETGKTVRYHALLSDSGKPKIWMSSAMPGYDERLLDREDPRYTDREDGRYFRTQLRTAFSTNPQWIRLYTWNEYPENTYIEPSKNFGDKYLDIAGEYLLPWKCAE